jgi:hypothetical protein
MWFRLNPRKWWGRWDLNPRLLALRLFFLRDASAPGSPRAVALWYPVGGIVFPDQAVQRAAKQSLLDDGPVRPRKELSAHKNLSSQAQRC